MFKFIDKKKICIILIALIALFALFAPTVVNAFAISYGEYRSGTVGEGIYPVNDTPITVKGMKLTFDISDFPIIDNDSGINYRSTVTSEYTLYNPTAEKAYANLVIAEPERPNYFKDDFERTPKIKVDGEPKETQVRYSNTRTISDEWYADSFFSPVLPVYVYKIKANISYAQLRGDIITDFTKARYIADGYSDFSCNYSTDGDNLFYILGDESAVNFNALSFYNYDNYDLVKISDPFELEKVETITLKDLVLKSNSPSEGISDLDWYNGILSEFSNGECVCGRYTLTENNLKKYYLYSVEVAPQSELTTSVTQPVLPDVSSDGVCNYYFDTSSAYSWDGFGKLEIEVNTDFYVYYCPSNFKKTDTGYKAVYTMAPHGTVRFSLSRKYSGNSGNNYPGGQENSVGDIVAEAILVYLLIRFVLAVFGGGISFIVLMIKKSKQR